MVLPIGFFMPLPLAMMIPFMGIQSAVMAKQFGENFQYGKRRISAMSNEEFNRLTPKILMENANAELKSMIPSMEQSIKDMSEFQTFLIGEFIKMIGDLLTAGLGKVLGLDSQGVDEALTAIEHFIHGHPSGHPKGSTEPLQTPVITPEGTLAPPPITFPKPKPKPTTDIHSHKGHEHKVTQTDVSIQGLPKAGQTQILERNSLIQKISNLHGLLANASTATSKTNIKNSIKILGEKLTALLARYNWI